MVYMHPEVPEFASLAIHTSFDKIRNKLFSLHLGVQAESAMGGMYVLLASAFNFCDSNNCDLFLLGSERA